MHEAYKVVHAELVSDETMVFFSFPGELNLAGKDSVAERVVRIINVALASATTTIAISSMTLFDSDNDWICEKLLELLEANPRLQLKLLMDDDPMPPNCEQLATLFRSKLGDGEVAVYSKTLKDKAATGPRDASCRIEIYGAGVHDGGPNDWLFHTKVIVVDQKLAIFTTANYRAQGVGGLSGEPRPRLIFRGSTSCLSGCRPGAGMSGSNPDN